MAEPLNPNPWRQLARKALAAVLPRRRFLASGPRVGSGLCLTFDDGPHPEHTPRVLDVLAAQGIHATFFVVGARAASHPEIVRRVVAEGHAIGHHSYHHHEPRETSASELLAEVEDSVRLIHELTGVKSRLFRPPHGNLTLAKLIRLLGAGQTVVLWNVDPRDFEAADGAELARRLRERPVRAGDLVLLHDSCPLAATALPGLVADAGARGLRFKLVSDWSG